MWGCPVNGSADDIAADSAYAVLVHREEQRWQASALPDEAAGELELLIAAVRRQPGEIGSFALVNVADEFFVVVRVQMGQIRLLLSDVSAAADWDLAAQVLDELELDPPDDDFDEVLPAGDLGVFEDLGLEEMELGAILADQEAYADEMLSTLARRLGFDGVYERIVDTLVG